MADPLQDLLAGGALPTVPLAPTSRYLGLGVATYEPPAAPGETPVPVTFLRRRLVPRPERFSTLYEVSCVEGDRRDLLAARHLGDPELWLEYCGLDIEDSCLHPERNEAPVATPSSAQVREPVHRRGLGQWRRYAQQLEPLRQALMKQSVL